MAEQKHANLAERAGRAARSLAGAYSARRQGKSLLRRLRDDIVTLALVFVAMWVVVNVIAHVVN